MCHSLPALVETVMARFVSLLALLLAHTVFAGQLGQPITQRYSPLETGTQPYSFAVLPRPNGEIFVANYDGVLRHFGQRWQLIEVGSSAYSLAPGKNGEVYVGGYHLFGVLNRQADGRYVFQRLDRNFIADDTGAPMGEVWDTLATTRGVYFATRSRVFYYDFGNEHRSFHVPGELQSMHADIDGSPIVVLRDKRILRLHDEWSDWLAPDLRIRAIVTLRQDQWLVAESGELLRVGKSAATPVATPHAHLGEVSAYVAAALPDGDVAIGTLAGDVYRFDPESGQHRVLTNAGSPVIALAADAENGLWVASELGLLRVSLDAAWTEIDARNGLSGGPPTHAAVWNDRLFVATTTGLYVSAGAADEQARFEMAGFANIEVNSLLVSPVGLVIGARSGLHLLSADGQLVALTEDLNVLALIASERVENRIYAIEDQGLLVFDVQNGILHESQRILDPSFRFSELVESGDDVYVDRLLSAPLRFVLDRNQRLTGPTDLKGSEPLRNGSVSADSQDAYVSTDHALYRFQGDRAIPVSEHPWIEAGIAPSAELKTSRCENGDRLASTARRLLWQANRQTEWRELHPMQGRSPGVFAVACGQGQLLAVTWSSLARFDTTHGGSLPALPAPRIEQVEFVSPGGQTSLAAIAGPILVPAGHRVRIHFASPFLGGSLRYQTRLDSESTWFDAPAPAVRELALSAGNYELELRAIDTAGRYSTVAALPFAVARDWRALMVNGMILLAALILLPWLLYLWRAKSLRFRNAELQAMVEERTQALAQRSMELESANQRLTALADIDGLTGVANRRKLEAAMQESWQAAIESHGPLALLMIDVDHFKQYNDTHGHLLGDERLQTLADRLKGWVVPGDTLARYGGEEFLMLLPNTAMSAATERANAICRDLRFTDRQGSASTVSIGVAERIASLAQTSEQLIEFADLALYRAKNDGRDRVEVYDPT